MLTGGGDVNQQAGRIGLSLLSFFGRVMRRQRAGSQRVVGEDTEPVGGTSADDLIIGLLLFLEDEAALTTNAPLIFETGMTVPTDAQPRPLYRHIIVG